MRISFTGTREGMSVKQMEAFEKFLKEHKVTHVSHGDAIGADAEAHAVARNLGLKLSKRPCNVRSQRAFTMGGAVVAAPEEPLKRNRKLVDDGAMLVACPKEFEEVIRSGTWATVRYAVERGKPVYIIWPDGYTLALNHLTISSVTTISRKVA